MSQKIQKSRESQKSNSALFLSVVVAAAPILVKTIDAASLSALMCSCSASFDILCSYVPWLTIIQDRGCQVLFHRKYPELRQLHILGSNVDVGASHIVELSRSSPMLRVFISRSSRLQMAAVQKLHTLAKLTTLKISSVDISTPAYKSMAQPGLLSVTELQLARTKLRVCGLQRLLSAAWLQRVTVLDISKNALGEEHFQLLARASLDSLTSLKASSSRMHKGSVQALTQGSWWQMLQNFSAQSSHLKADGMQILCSTASRKLATLDLSGNIIDADGMTAIMNGTWPQLRRLTLNSCSLWGKTPVLDVPLLAKANIPMLEALSLNNNVMNTEAMYALCGCIHNFPLQELHLRNTGLTGYHLWILYKSLVVDEDQTVWLQLLDVAGNNAEMGVDFYCIDDSQGKLVRSRRADFARSKADYDYYDEWVQSRFEVQHEVILKMV